MGRPKLCSTVADRRLQFIQEHVDMPVSMLSRKMGLSRNTVMRIVNDNGIQLPRERQEVWSNPFQLPDGVYFRVHDHENWLC
jgi:hypothetical protein